MGYLLARSDTRETTAVLEDTRSTTGWSMYDTLSEAKRNKKNQHTHRNNNNSHNRGSQSQTRTTPQFTAHRQL